MIKDLYFGELKPNCSVRTESERCTQAMDKLVQNETSLAHLLKEEDRALLYALLDAQSEVTGELTVRNFEEGFKLGAKLMREIYSD